MKVIIAGGRNYRLTDIDFEKLAQLAMRYRFTEIVSGGCRGADKGGEFFAQKAGLPLKIFNADWSSHGRSAGPLRNEAMAKYADALISFPGGAGTRNMISTAKKYNLLIFKRLVE